MMNFPERPLLPPHLPSGLPTYQMPHPNYMPRFGSLMVPFPQVRGSNTPSSNVSFNLNPPEDVLEGGFRTPMSLFSHHPSNTARPLPQNTSSIPPLPASLPQSPKRIDSQTQLKKQIQEYENSIFNFQWEKEKIAAELERVVSLNKEREAKLVGKIKFLQREQEEADRVKKGEDLKAETEGLTKQLTLLKSQLREFKKREKEWTSQAGPSAEDFAAQAAEAAAEHQKEKQALKSSLATSKAKLEISSRTLSTLEEEIRGLKTTIVNLGDKRKLEKQEEKRKTDEERKRLESRIKGLEQEVQTLEQAADSVRSQSNTGIQTEASPTSDRQLHFAKAAAETARHAGEVALLAAETAKAEAEDWKAKFYKIKDSQINRKTESRECQAVEDDLGLGVQNMEISSLNSEQGTKGDLPGENQAGQNINSTESMNKNIPSADKTTSRAAASPLTVCISVGVNTTLTSGAKKGSPVEKRVSSVTLKNTPIKIPADLSSVSVLRSVTASNSHNPATDSIPNPSPLSALRKSTEQLNAMIGNSSAPLIFKPVRREIQPRSTSAVQSKDWLGRVGCFGL